MQTPHDMKMAYLMSASALLEAVATTKDKAAVSSYLKLADTTLVRYRKAAAALKDRQVGSSEASNSNLEKQHTYYLMVVRNYLLKIDMGCACMCNVTSIWMH